MIIGMLMGECFSAMRGGMFYPPQALRDFVGRVSGFVQLLPSPEDVLYIG
jgi:hypothetical protein